MIKKGKELAKQLKGKKVVVVTGQLCNEIEFGRKKLLDYAVEISNKLMLLLPLPGIPLFL
jgi:hypothetical protein